MILEFNYIKSTQVNMKKIIIAMLLVAITSPAVTFAQTQTTQVNQNQQVTALIQLLLEQVKILQAQLDKLLAEQKENKNTVTEIRVTGNDRDREVVTSKNIDSKTQKKLDEVRAEIKNYEYIRRYGIDGHECRAGGSFIFKGKTLQSCGWYDKKIEDLKEEEDKILLSI